MEIIILLLLIGFNGVLAMAEIAVVSARKSRLEHLAQEGDKNARLALELAQNPSRFLSTIQVGITLVGILAGAFGGATIAETLSGHLGAIAILAPYSDALSLAIVVILITYFSLIIGELVPKRIALSNPEAIAAFVARPMNFLASLVTPVIDFLGSSTDRVLQLIGIKSADQAPISEEEIKLLIREGARAGVFGLAEKDIVERTLSLRDRKVNSLMTPQKEIVWLDIDSSFKTIRNKVTQTPHSHFPVCRDTIDKVIGIIRTEDILINYLEKEKMDLKKSLHKPLFIPETMQTLKVLELFKKSGIHTALIVDEYGSIQGLLSLTDILEAIVGDIPTINELEDQDIIKRDDNSWFVDGLISIDEFKEYFHLSKLPGERTGNYHTIGGFMMFKHGRIPVPGDVFMLENLRFEVVDMDGNRVDKILVSLGKESSETPSKNK